MIVIGDVRGKSCFLLTTMVDTAFPLQRRKASSRSAARRRSMTCAFHGVLSGPANDRI